VDVVISNCVINLSTEYRTGLASAGFTTIDVTPTHDVAEGMHSATITATKPPS
jgi:hypothetical protein